METKDLIKKLKKLSRIMPSKDFSKKSKFLLASISPDEPSGKVGDIFTAPIFGRFQIILKASTFSIVGIVALVFIYYFATQLSPLFLPGLNYKNIVAEADTVNAKIDIQLSQIKHFKEASSEGKSVLKEVSLNSFSHLNEPVITKEGDLILKSIPDPVFNANTSKETNDILREISE